MKVNKYAKNVLCSILTAAMILTGSSIPQMSVYATEETVEDTDTTENSKSDTDTTKDSDVEDEDDEKIPAGAFEDEDDTDSDKNETDSDEEVENDTEEDDEDEPDGSEDDEEEKDDEEENDDEHNPIIRGLLASEDEETEDYGTLQNGGFETAEPDNSYQPADWDLDWTAFSYKSGDMDGYGHYAYWWADSKSDISISQTIENVEPGYYVVSLEAGGVYEKGDIDLKVAFGENDSDPISVDLGDAASAWGVWSTISTPVFEITEENNSSITISISGTLSDDSGTEEQLHVDNVALTKQTTYSLDELKALYETASGYTQTDYTEDSWTVFASARDTAKTLIDDSSDDTIEITNTYITLFEAMDDLVLATASETVSSTLYYYYGGTDKTLGVAFWDGNAVSCGDDVTWSSEEWTIGDDWNASVALMEESEAYPGWYSIDLVFDTSTTSGGFQIHCSDNASTSLFTCDPTYNYTDIFTKLCSGDADSYALKSSILYAGDLAAAVMRNVTLYVYSEEGTPKIVSENELSVVDETSGEKVTLTTDETIWSTSYGYHMTADKDYDNWYYLSFSAPDADTVCQLVVGDSNDWVTKFVNASTESEDETDFTPVFAGKIYATYEGNTVTLSDSRDAALGLLKALLESEAVETIVINHEENADYYTSETWTAFDEAKTQAEAVVNDNTSQADDYTSTEITEAYNALSSAIENMVRNVSDVALYYYSEALSDYANTETETYNLYMSTWNNDKVSSSKEPLALIQSWGSYTAFAFEEITDESINHNYKNWYLMPVKPLNAGDGADGDGFIIQVGKATATDEGITHTAEPSDNKVIEISYWSNSSVYNAIVSGEAESIVVMGTKMYASIAEAEAAALTELVAEAEVLEADDYKADGWSDFTKALEDAKTLLGTAYPSHEDLQDRYDALKAAMDALVSNVVADINVAKVALEDDFITGADLSSYVALKQSGVVFKDSDGNALSDAEFFQYLKDGGTNWVRIRVWNDPYNSNGQGYGGGNNDLDKAITIGQLATNAGMRVLIDFHYSDFWADPGKQDAPKAWAAYSVEQKETAVYEYTLDSLNALKDAGVDVGMVQVGNETNNGICGESTWANMAKIFNAGSKAVKDFDENCLVAVHFTNPEKGYDTIAGYLDTYKVNYDVFASSYYPFWHGTTSNLTEQLEAIAAKGKKVMVAETSWATTWEDGDGHGNTVALDKTLDLNYGISVQGQADELRDVVYAANKVNDTVPGSSIGVFYWEPAWISPYYVYNADGSIDRDLYAKNKALWEEYGSGWASSYSSEYDPDDAGMWYGGSAIDNQSWFDFDGTALPTARIYSLIRTGASAERAIASVDTKLTLELKIGDTLFYPTVTATYNDGTTEQYEVDWEEDEQKLVSTDKVGEYTVSGKVICESKEYNVLLTIKVTRGDASNKLVNPGFEAQGNGWNQTYIKGSGSVGANGDNPRNGSYGYNFYSEEAIQFTLTQTLTDLEEGIYTFGGYIQGNDMGSDNLQYAFAEVYDENNNLKAIKNASATLDGWMIWNNPEVTGISVSEGDTLVVGMKITLDEPYGWGSFDDLYLYGKYDITVDSGIQNGTVTVSDLEVGSGERVKVTATPDNGYYLSMLTISGNSIDADMVSTLLQSSQGTTAFVAGDDSASNAVVLNYDGQEITEAISEYFIMPNGNVNISAVFTSIFDENAKISLDESNSDIKVEPIEDQWATGKKITPAVEVSYKGYKLTSADYTVTYQNNIKVGTAQAVLKGKGKFEGTRTVGFTIKEDTRINISKFKVVLQNCDVGTTSYYLGEQEEVEPKIQLMNGTTEIDSGSYTLYYQNNKKIGTATLVVLPNEDSNYTGSVTKTFKIVKCPMNSNNIEVTVPATSFTYTGSKITPSVTVKYQGKTLSKGKDYTVTYSNNMNVSTEKKSATIKITGIGNYTGNRTTYDVAANNKAGTKKLIFMITPKSISASGITITAASLASTGKAQAPKLTVKDGITKLSAKQYEITKIVMIEDENGTAVSEQSGTIYTKGTKGQTAKVKEAGKYEVTIVGKGNYDSETTKTAVFYVVGKDHLVSNAKIKITGKYYYTGNAVTPDMTVNISGVELDEDDYTVSYINSATKTATNINAGKATVTITGNEAKGYCGTKTATFTINKRTLAAELGKKNASATGIVQTPVFSKTVLTQIESDGGTVSTLDESTVQDSRGNYIAVAIPYTGYAQTPAVTFTSVNGTETDSVTRTLINGTDYTISYKNNVKGGNAASVTIKGKGNYSGSVTIKNVFTVKARSLDDYTITVDSAVYTGKAVKPAVTFTDKTTGKVVDLKAGTAYTVTYRNNVKVANRSAANAKTTPYAVVTIKGLLKSESGSKKTENLYFTINKAAITEADVSDIAIQTYKGKAVTPTVTIKVNGRKLKAGTDYVVAYTNNTKQSSDQTIGYAVIEGKGSYSTLTPIVKKFVIK